MTPLTNPTSAPLAASAVKPMKNRFPVPATSSAPPMPGTPANTVGVLRPQEPPAPAPAPASPSPSPQVSPASAPAPSSAPPAATQVQPQPEMTPEGAVINPTWQGFVDIRRSKLKKGATPEELAAIEAEASQQLEKFADANKVMNADAATMNASQKATEGAIAKANEANRGRTTPQKPLLTPSSAPPSVAGPMFPSNAAAAGMANAMNDANNGIVSRGGGMTTTTQGGVIQQGAGGTKTVSSPFGATGSAPGAAGYSIDTGKMGPGDANLRAQTAAMKTRQAGGVFSPTAPTVASSAPPAVAAASPAPSPPVAAAPSPSAPRMPSLNPTGGTTAAGVMSNTPSPTASPAPAVAAPAPKSTNNAIAVLGQPVVNNLNTGSNYIPSSRPVAPAPTSAPPAVAATPAAVTPAAAAAKGIFASPLAQDFQKAKGAVMGLKAKFDSLHQPRATSAPPKVPLQAVTAG